MPKSGPRAESLGERRGHFSDEVTKMALAAIKSEIEALSAGVSTVERAFALLTIRDLLLPKIIDKRYNNIKNALFNALRWRDYDEFIRLLEYCRVNQIDINSMREKTMGYCTLLIASVIFKVPIEFVKELVNVVEPRAQDIEGNTVLHVSLLIGDSVLHITKYIITNYYPILSTIMNKNSQCPDDVVRQSVDIKENYNTVIYSIEKMNKLKSEKKEETVEPINKPLDKKLSTRSPSKYYVPTVGVLPSHKTYYHDEYGHIEIAGDFFVTADELSPDNIVHREIVEENPDLTPINVNNVIIHVRLPKQEPFEPDRDRRRELRREKCLQQRDPVLYSAKKELYLAKR